MDRSHYSSCSDRPGSIHANNANTNNNNIINNNNNINNNDGSTKNGDNQNPPPFIGSIPRRGIASSATPIGNAAAAASSLVSRTTAVTENGFIHAAAGTPPTQDRNRVHDRLPSFHPSPPQRHNKPPSSRDHYGQQQQSHISIKSEHPFVLTIQLPPGTMSKLYQKKRSPKRTIAPAPVPTPNTTKRTTTTATPTIRVRQSGREPKRTRTTYQEATLTDSDDFMSEDEEKELVKKQLKKRKYKKKDATPSSSSNDGSLVPPTGGAAAAGDTYLPLVESAATTMAMPLSMLPVVPDAIDAPPPGTLASLWYSRECLNHVFVMEKVLGWKTRPVVRLDFRSNANDNDNGDKVVPVLALDIVEAATMSGKLLAQSEYWNEARKRQEVSRINGAHCPVVLPMIAAKEAFAAKKNGKQPRYVLAQPKEDLPPPIDGDTAAVKKTVPVQREEVLLIKWRGRSHLHCSWERRSDLERLDPSNNTARHKIRRYLANQEMVFGKEWKKVLEEERSSAPDLHPHDAAAVVSHAAQPEKDNKSGNNPATAAAPSTITTDTNDNNDSNAPEEELFPPEYLEVERILSCDENEMDMTVLARQRTRNLRAEQEHLFKREEEAKQTANATTNTSADSMVVDDSRSNIIPTISATTTTTTPLSVLNNPLINEAEEAPWDPEDNVRYIVKWKGQQYSEITWEYWRDIKTDAVDHAEEFWIRQKAPTAEEVKKRLNKPHPNVRDFRKLAKSPAFGMSKRSRPIGDLGDGLMSDVKEEDEKDPGFSLRSYQLEGVNWLLWNWWNKRSCILADEMGLGKTIQTLGFLHQLQESPSSQVAGPFLVVAPLSLIQQWQSESTAWAPDMNVLFYHGSADARNFLVRQEFYYTDQFIPKATAIKLKKQHVTKFHILITTYEVVLKDINVLSKIQWKCLVVDEAHRLKNPKARLFEELASVPRDFCLLLTGTPLQNSTEELWALLHFADPVAFASKEAFVDKFGQLTDSKQVSDLHSVLKPFLLRRVKEDVEKSLPPKEETILEVSLTPIQKTFYKAIYERNTAFLYKGSKPSNAPSLMNVMMELRKCCNHPFLVRGTEERILLEAATALKSKNDENGKDVVVDYFKLFCEHLVKSSGKMVLLDKLLPKLFSGGHKVLIFSQMVRVLDLLEELVKIKQYRYERLDGSTSASARSAAVQRFGKKSLQRFVMLLSTRAGGLGLNLTAADTVIIFDSDWNPQNDLQAMARAHRIGQTRAVRVYRLLTAKTYEMHMFHSASMKLGLDRAMLAQQRQEGEEGTETKNKGKSDRQVQAKEIDELLKKGAYDVFRDDDDTEAKQFMESDIDQLLEKNSKQIAYGNTGSSLSSGLGSFSKASFVADTGDGEKDVDLDDPNFWEKAVGLDAPPTETPEDIAAMLDDGVKRSRKQVQMFDPFAAFAEAEQKKKDKIDKKLKDEKAERERLRLEKRQTKLEEKERRRRDRDDARGRFFGQSKLLEIEEEDDDDLVKTGGKSKKVKKSERTRALRRAHNEDPILERLKQAWETPQRNRATSAALRFGFGRYCKIRNESNLTSLPIQDLEVFVRAYVYQLSLQAAVSLLSLLESKLANKAEIADALDGCFRPMVQKWLGLRREEEVDWICESICSAIKLQNEVNCKRRFLRIPYILAEPNYVADLRNGAAFRSLRRIGVLCRVNRMVEDALDRTLAGLGQEELGKRGCTTKDLTTLDADLKSRHVTAEELRIALGAQLRSQNVRHRPPVVWWDRSCDIGLVIGTFVHGFGNYEMMRNDEDLPFAYKIRQYAKNDDHCCRAYLSFNAATTAARKVFDDALETSKLKAQEEAHQAVAAALAASKLAEQEGSTAVREGENPPSTPLSKSDLGAITAKPCIIPSNVQAAQEKMDKDDTHLVTLPRLCQSLVAAVRVEARGRSVKKEYNGKNGEDSASEADTDEDCLPLHHRLPMPDAPVLDSLLQLLVLGRDSDNSKTLSPGIVDWEASAEVIKHERIHNKALATILAEPAETVSDDIPHRCIGFSGTQCAANHRSLDDGSNFSVGSASSELSAVATGNDAPRYLRAIGVPMNITRFCVSALVYADSPVLARLLSTEKRFSRAKDEDILDSQSDTPDAAPSAVLSSSNAGTEAAIPQLFSDNAELRAGICVTALYNGVPRVERGSIAEGLLATLGQVTKDTMFSAENFLEVTSSVASISQLPDEEALYQYMDDIFLPHCLRLAIKGNGPSTLDGRASKGEYETAFGVSLNPENTGHRQTPLPDPKLPLSAHSTEAVACASAIIRRYRLLRTAQFVVSGGVSTEAVEKILRGSIMQKGMSGLPTWWCPWIHDLALLVHASTHGLFSILSDRQDTAKVKGTPFDAHEIEKHIHATFLSNATLPTKITDIVKSDKLQKWANAQATQFPSVNVIERRLALVCSELTADIDGEQRYDNVPMFDHGGWPRN